MPLSTASAIADAVSAATQDPWHVLPNAAVLVTTSDEAVAFSGVGGYERVPSTSEELADAPRLSEDSRFTLWSCTKLVTAIAALQLVEQGKIGLEDDASRWVPELEELRVFKGFKENGELELEKPERRVTVEMLLLHTAGFDYDHPDSARIIEKLGITSPYDPKSTRISVTRMPAFYPAGENWHYGPSNDWLALVIEAASGVDLDTYFKQNIFEPLGIHDTTFKPDPLRINMAYAPKEPDGPYTFDEGRRFSQAQYWGGTGLSGSPRSYLKLLRALLLGGAVEKGSSTRILRQETVELMFHNHLETAQHLQDLHAMTKTGNDPFTHRGKSDALPLGHGYGGSLSGEGLPSGRGRGALTWSGYANTYWVVDREKDVAFVVWTNIIPHSAPRIFDLWERVEPLIYEGLDKKK
ncbi:hypothetical protein JCM10207_001284 [Rhodosporidiobolus poonsookiae]